MATYTFAFTTSGFPSNFVGTLDQLITAWTASLSATVSTDSIILGAIQDTAPSSHISPWLDTSIPAWKVWDGSNYVPVLQRLGNANFAITFNTTLTANRTVTFQDNDGIVAYLADVYTPRSTFVVPVGTTPNIDWSDSNTFYHAVGAANTVTMSNSLPGQEIAVVLESSGNFVVTWVGVQWAGGTAPTQSDGTTLSGKDLYVFNNIAGTIYGQQVATVIS